MFVLLFVYVGLPLSSSLNYILYAYDYERKKKSHLHIVFAYIHTFTDTRDCVLVVKEFKLSSLKSKEIMNRRSLTKPQCTYAQNTH